MTARSIPVLTMRVSVGDSEVTRSTNALVWFRADKALGESVLACLGSFTGLAATSYALTAGAELAFLKAHGGTHPQAFEAWLALDPDFEVVEDPEADPTEAAEPQSES